MPSIDNMHILYEVGGLEMLDRVRPLWSELNQTLATKTVHFPERFRTNTFEKRMRPVLEKIEGGHIRIEIVALDGVDIGYCVSTVTKDHIGEVDSIYIRDERRNEGVGGTLLDQAVSWIKDQGAERIVLSVTFGNEEASRFYERHGFRPRTMIYEWKG